MMRIATLLALALTMHATAGEQNPDRPRPAERLLTDFTDRSPELRWTLVLDGVMGGRSSGRSVVADGRLTFTGSLNTDGGGFASLRSEPTGLDLAGFEGVRLRVRGDGRTYTMRLQQAGETRGRDVSYRADFTTIAGNAWHDAWLPFDAFVPMWRGRRLDLPPVDPARIDSIGLMIADSRDGPFRIEVDSIGAYGAIDLDEPCWRQRRPLLLFAPAVDDLRLADQLADLESARSEFDARDMTLLVVLETGASRAGDRPLRADAVAALRARFDVPPGTFGLRLVGKDGSVKRAASAPVALAELFAQVDAMPMRRAERGRGDQGR